MATHCLFGRFAIETAARPDRRLAQLRTDLLPEYSAAGIGCVPAVHRVAAGALQLVRQEKPNDGPTQYPGGDKWDSSHSAGRSVFARCSNPRFEQSGVDYSAGRTRRPRTDARLALDA